MEQRLFATLFEGAPAEGVTRALEAYRNEDGGFGHGLEPPTDAHELRELLRFLEHVPDRERAERIRPLVAAALPSAKWFLADAASDDYGVTPLQLAPTPASPARALFGDAQVEAHLDRLEADQHADGGWPIRWVPPSAASLLEWRGVFTVNAVTTLRAYGRL